MTVEPKKRAWASSSLIGSEAPSTHVGGPARADASARASGDNERQDVGLRRGRVHAQRVVLADCDDVDHSQAEPVDQGLDPIDEATKQGVVREDLLGYFDPRSSPDDSDVAAHGAGFNAREPLRYRLWSGDDPPHFVGRS